MQGTRKFTSKVGKVAKAKRLDCNKNCNLSFPCSVAISSPFNKKLLFGHALSVSCTNYTSKSTFNVDFDDIAKLTGMCSINKT